MIHPFISGNKWRKLKYHLQTALQQKKHHLVTFGGVWSNHLVATACTAAKFGLTSTAFIRGEELQTDALFFCKLFGMNLIFTDRESYRDKKKLFANEFENDNSAYFIDEGGAGIEALLGCAELASELTETYDHIFCAAGTGATAAGLIKGVSEKYPESRVSIVPVLKGADFVRREIASQITFETDFDFYPDYHFGGYAKSSPQLLQFIKEFSAQTGILLDPVYTGKMMFALFDLVKKDQFPSKSTLLAIHTGGLTGLLGFKDKFSNL